VPYAQIIQDGVVKRPEEVLDFMKGDQFDPKKMVVFEPGRGFEERRAKKGEAFEASCAVVDYGHEHIVIKTSSSQSGYLVLSEVFYPGWHAEVDGERVDVLCGNYIFRVIPIDKGEHRVDLYFISRPFRIGAVTSVITLLSSLIFLVLTQRKSIFRRFCCARPRRGRVKR
jgi:hypothetical protein